MALLGNILKRSTKQKEDQVDGLIKCFLSLQGRSDFPLALAEQNYQDILQNAPTQREQLEYLLEDSIFSSLYATFYEQILMTIEQNSHLFLELIESFEADHEERERNIATQTEHHLSYVKNGGQCEGCSSCENHNDVHELVSFYARSDFHFIKTLFIGMQTIQFTMDHILYNFLPNQPELIKSLTPENILKFRQYIFNYAQTSASHS